MPDDVMHTSDVAYFRFHGPDKPYASMYSREQPGRWTDAIRQLVKTQQVKEVFCYFNNDFYGYAPEDAQTLHGLLEET